MCLGEEHECKQSWIYSFVLVSLLSFSVNMEAAKVIALLMQFKTGASCLSYVYLLFSKDVER